MEHALILKQRKGANAMREFWVTVGAMVLGYVLYIIVKSISKK